MNYRVGDIVVTRMHKGDRQHKRLLRITRITAGGKVQVIGEHGKRMSLEHRQIVLIRKK
jgi:hypothetical protein